MKTVRVFYHLALSDFRERTRRYSFLIVLGLVGYLGYVVNTGDFSLKLGATYRGVYNSAWIGTEMTLVINFVLSLFGFFLVKNSVERDTRTGVGQIIATTPLRGRAYLPPGIGCAARRRHSRAQGAVAEVNGALRQNG